MVQLILNQLGDRIGTATSRSMEAGDEACLSFIKGEFHNCRARHTACKADGAKPLLPDRVIWLKAPTQDGIQLIEPENVRADYITLSYCWGAHGDDIFRTDMSTLEFRKHGMLFADLPPLFQDVAFICRDLGVDYLWYVMQIFPHC